MAPKKIQIAPIAGRAGGPRTALVNPLVGPPSVTLGDAFGSIASGFDALAEAAHEDDVKRDSIKAVQVEGGFQREVDAELAKLDPMASDYLTRVQDLLNSAQETAISEADFLTTDVSEITTKRLTAQVESFRTLAQVDRRNAIEKVALTERRQGVDTALANIRKDPDGIGAYIAKFTQDLQRLNTSISFAEQQAFADKFTDATLIAQVEGLALAGRIGEAQALADFQEDELNPKQFRALKKRIRSIETQVRQDVEVENESEIADLEIAVLNQTNPETARQMVQAAQDRDLFVGKEGKRVVLERMILAKESEQRKLQEARTLILAKVTTGTGLDSQKEADTLWDMIVENEKPRLEGLDQKAREEAMLTMAVQLAPKIGYLPTPLKRIIENAEIVEDPAILSRAARYHDTIAAAAPGVNTGIGDRGKAVSAAHDLLGIKYDEAAQYVIQRLPDEKVLTFRVKQFDVVALDFVATEALADVFDVDAEQVPTAAAIKYERMLRLMFNQSGDLNVAQAVTARTMKERFGVTSVGSPTVGYVTEFPPEAFIPGVAATSLTTAQKAMIITADAQRGLDALGIKSAVIEGAGDTSSLRFVVTDRTRRQIAAGERPEYDIYVLNSFNIPVKTALSYVMPTTELLLAIPEYARIAEDAKAAAADARSRAQVGRQGFGQGEGPGASSGVQTPGIPQGPGPTQFKLPAQGLPAGAQGVLTGGGGA